MVLLAVGNEDDITRLSRVHVRALDVADLADQRVDPRSNFNSTPKVWFQ